MDVADRNNCRARISASRARGSPETNLMICKANCFVRGSRSFSIYYFSLWPFAFLLGRWLCHNDIPNQFRKLRFRHLVVQRRRADQDRFKNALTGIPDAVPDYTEARGRGPSGFHAGRDRLVGVAFARMNFVFLKTKESMGDGVCLSFENNVARRD